LIVGGMSDLLMALMAAISSTAAVAPSMWPKQLFVELMGTR